MKFKVLQQDLLPALQAVSRCVGIRATLPVLNNILLSIEDGRLKLTATNLEIGVIKYINIETAEEGQITVPAKTLNEVIASLPQSKVEIDATTELFTIKSGKFKATLSGIPSSEFPAIPLSEGIGVKFDKDVLLQIGQILFAAALDEGRPVLTGVLTEANKGILNLVATDGFRLAHRQLKLPDSKFEFKSLIPKKTFEELLRLIGEEEAETVNIATSKSQNQVVFTIGSTILSSRLIEGQFPNWEKIIPQQIVTRVTVEKDEFLKAVRLAAIFAKTEASIVNIGVETNGLKLSSEAKELGSQENEINASIEGEKLEIAFNTKFLLDILSAVNSNQLLIEFSGPLSPALIKPMGVEGLEYIIMPVRLN